MKIVSTVPSRKVTEQLSVQPVADLAGAEKLRANVWTLAPGDWSWGRHAHRAQEELYLVLDGRLRVEAGAPFGRGLCRCLPTFSPVNAGHG